MATALIWRRVGLGIAACLIIGVFHLLHGTWSLAATLGIIAAVVVLIVLVELVMYRTDHARRS